MNDHGQASSLKRWSDSTPGRNIRKQEGIVRPLSQPQSPIYFLSPDTVVLMCVPGHIHGVSVCTTSPGVMQSCQDIVFTKASRERMLGKLVPLPLPPNMCFIFLLLFAAASPLDGVS